MVFFIRETYDRCMSKACEAFIRAGAWDEADLALAEEQPFLMMLETATVSWVSACIRAVFTVVLAAGFE
jgi:hypothetical protein